LKGDDNISNGNISQYQKFPGEIFQNALVNVFKDCWNDIQTGTKEVCFQRQFALQHPEEMKYLPKHV